MTSATGNPFSAAASATGYLYQCRFALVEALRRLRTEQPFQVWLESLDDIVFEQTGGPLELIQTKHHSRRTPDLTDASVDLWKTVRVWADAMRSGTVPAGSRFLMITTAHAGPGSAASCLRIGTDRDIDRAVTKLRATAATSENAANEQAYGAFRALTPEAQVSLVQSIWLVDESSRIEELDNELREECFFAVDRRHLPSFVTSLEGWWLRRAIQHLSVERGTPIDGQDLAAQFDYLRQQYQENNLPIDSTLEQMTVDAIAYEERVFVQQLRLIAIGNERVIRAVRDYCRAFSQRSRWVREDLLGVGDLAAYERRLRDAWEGRFLIMRDGLGTNAPEPEQMRGAKSVYEWVETGDLPRIRPLCVDGFVARGSYQFLADRLELGWHPDFETRLQHLSPLSRGSTT
jgi:hypothetical protein